MTELESKYRQALTQIGHLLDANFAANAEIERLTMELTALKESASVTNDTEHAAPGTDQT